LYGFEPKTGRLLWKLDFNPANAVSRRPGVWPTRDFFLAVPTVHGHMLFAALSQEPEFGPDDRRALFAVDLRLVQKSPERAIRWRFVNKDFGGAFGSVAIWDDVLYTLGGRGVLFALEVQTGKELWRSYLDGGPGNSTALVSPCVHGGKVLVGENDLFVFQAGRRRKCLGRYELNNDGVQGTPVVDGNTVYVSTSSSSLWALRLPD
jgi:outer membrane protein assembly factor BamB